MDPEKKTPTTIKRRLSFSNESSSTTSAISYDSDDEMVRSTRSDVVGTGGNKYQGHRSLSRASNKRGHPIYSREDIREQYCINSKELDFFEEGAFEGHRSLFGCLSSSNLLSTDSSNNNQTCYQRSLSPCSKTSFIPDCVRRSFHLYVSSSPRSKVSGHNSRRRNKQTKQQKTSKVEDADDSDGGFKKHKPKARICFVDNEVKLSPVPDRGHFSPPPNIETRSSTPGGILCTNNVGGQHVVGGPHQTRLSFAPSPSSFVSSSANSIAPTISGGGHLPQVTRYQSTNVCSHHHVINSQDTQRQKDVRFCINNPDEHHRRRSSSGSSNVVTNRPWQGAGGRVGPAPVKGINLINRDQYMSSHGHGHFIGGQQQQQQLINNMQQSMYQHHYQYHRQPVQKPLPQVRHVLGTSPSPVSSYHETSFIPSVVQATTCPIHNRCPSTSSVILPPFDPVNQTFARYYYYYRPLNSRQTRREKSAWTQTPPISTSNLIDASVPGHGQQQQRQTFRLKPETTFNNQQQMLARDANKETGRLMFARQSSADHHPHQQQQIHQQLNNFNHSNLMRASSSPSASCFNPVSVPINYIDSGEVEQEPETRTSKSFDNLNDEVDINRLDASYSEPTLNEQTPIEETLTAIEVLRSTETIAKRQLSSETSFDISSPSEKPEPPPQFKDVVAKDDDEEEEEKKAVGVIERCILRRNKMMKMKKMDAKIDAKKKDDARSAKDAVYGVVDDESTTSGSFMIETPVDDEVDAKFITTTAKEELLPKEKDEENNKKKRNVITAKDEKEIDEEPEVIVEGPVTGSSKRIGGVKDTKQTIQKKKQPADETKFIEAKEEIEFISFPQQGRQSIEVEKDGTQDATQAKDEEEVKELISGHKIEQDGKKNDVDTTRLDTMKRKRIVVPEETSSASSADATYVTALSKTPTSTYSSATSGQLVTTSTSTFETAPDSVSLFISPKVSSGQLTNDGVMDIAIDTSSPEQDVPVAVPTTGSRKGSTSSTSFAIPSALGHENMMEEEGINSSSSSSSSDAKEDKNKKSSSSSSRTSLTRKSVIVTSSPSERRSLTLTSYPMNPEREDEDEEDDAREDAKEEDAKNIASSSSSSSHIPFASKEEKNENIFTESLSRNILLYDEEEEDGKSSSSKNIEELSPFPVLRTASSPKEEAKFSISMNVVKGEEDVSSKREEIIDPHQVSTSSSGSGDDDGGGVKEAGETEKEEMEEDDDDDENGIIGVCGHLMVSGSDNDVSTSATEVVTRIDPIESVQLRNVIPSDDELVPKAKDIIIIPSNEKKIPQGTTSMITSLGSAHEAITSSEARSALLKMRSSFSTETEDEQCSSSDLNILRLPSFDDKYVEDATLKTPTAPSSKKMIKTATFSKSSSESITEFNLQEEDEDNDDETFEVFMEIKPLGGDTLHLTNKKEGPSQHLQDEAKDNDDDGERPVVTSATPLSVLFPQFTNQSGVTSSGQVTLRRTMSVELSTVSEVSEEVSAAANGANNQSSFAMLGYHDIDLKDANSSQINSSSSSSASPSVDEAKDKKKSKKLKEASGSDMAGQGEKDLFDETGSASGTMKRLRKKRVKQKMVIAKDDEKDDSSSSSTSSSSSCDDKKRMKKEKSDSTSGSFMIVEQEKDAEDVSDVSISLSDAIAEGDANEDVSSSLQKIQDATIPKDSSSSSSSAKDVAKDVLKDVIILNKKKDEDDDKRETLHDLSITKREGLVSKVSIDTFRTCSPEVAKDDGRTSSSSSSSSSSTTSDSRSLIQQEPPLTTMTSFPVTSQQQEALPFPIFHSKNAFDTKTDTTGQVVSGHHDITTTGHALTDPVIYEKLKQSDATQTPSLQKIHGIAKDVSMCSQDTEKDVMRSEFSLEQQSSIDIEESLSMSTSGRNVATSGSKVTTKLASTSGAQKTYPVATKEMVPKRLTQRQVTAPQLQYHPPTTTNITFYRSNISSSSRTLLESESKTQVTTLTDSPLGSKVSKIASKSDESSKTIDFPKESSFNLSFDTKDVKSATPGQPEKDEKDDDGADLKDETKTLIVSKDGEDDVSSKYQIPSKISTEKSIDTIDTLKNSERKLSISGMDTSEKRVLSGTSSVTTVSLPSSGNNQFQSSSSSRTFSSSSNSKTSSSSSKCPKGSLDTYQEAEILIEKNIEKQDIKMPEQEVEQNEPEMEKDDEFCEENISNISFENIGKCDESYKSFQWLYINKKAELDVWGQLSGTPFVSNVSTVCSDDEIIGSDTESEKCFRKSFETITHRMIHRKASIELIRRIINNTFKTEKKVSITRVNGEFGFRIHGSRPVVVSAIESGTPAESCGLQVGDIIVTLNGENVLESSHSDIVRIAHSGTETLEMELIGTRSSLGSVLEPLGLQSKCLMSGYLERKRRAAATSGCSDIKGSSTKTLPRTTPSNVAPKEWKRRYFTLHSNLNLFWYKNEDDTKPMGVIKLANCSASLLKIEPIKGVKFAGSSTNLYVFTITGPSGLTTGQSSGSVTPSFVTTTSASTSLASNLASSTTSSAAKKIVIQTLATHSAESALKWVDILNDTIKKYSSTDPYYELSSSLIKSSINDIKSPEVVGYLYKHLNAERNVWIKIFLVLKDCCLYFYDNESSTTSSGCVYLQGYKVQSCSVSGKKNTFELVPPPGYENGKHFIFMAKDDIDKKRWLTTLEYSIDRWMRMKSFVT